MITRTSKYKDLRCEIDTYNGMYERKVKLAHDTIDEHNKKQSRRYIMDKAEENLKSRPWWERTLVYLVLAIFRLPHMVEVNNERAKVNAFREDQGMRKISMAEAILSDSMKDPDDPANGCWW